MRRQLWLFLLTLLAACTATMSSPSDDVLDTAEWRRALLGTWTVEFRLDSVRIIDASGAHWRPGSLQAATGILRVTRISTSRSTDLTSSLSVDFTPLLGRQISCFDPRPTTTAVNRDAELITLVFTPNVADCGFSAAGRLQGDSLVGSWGETSFAGPTVAGRFRMTRART